MSSLVRVVRGKPRHRGEIQELVGRIEVELRVCSRERDGVDSYLHVGTGVLRLVLDVDLLKRGVATARTRQDLERLKQRLSETVQIDYAQFVSTRGRLVVPGSSVKGNVRARLELSFVPKNGFVRSCLVKATEEPLEPPPEGEHGWRHFKIWREALSFKRESACDYSDEKSSVCLVCDLFGTTGLRGLIEFGDLVGENVRHERVDLPTGEKLEVAGPGSTFAGTFSFKNIKAWELGLLLYGMGLRNSRTGRTVLFGKVKYRRHNRVFGVVRYEVRRLELAPISRVLEAVSYTHLTLPTIYSV